MAILTDEERRELWAEIMRQMSNEREPCSITKTDLRAAVDAVDNWIDANMASFNSSIPQPARSALTAKQKARLLMLIVKRRFEVS